MSRHHLCWEFKKNTGQTIHSYIVKSRLNLCKNILKKEKQSKKCINLADLVDIITFSVPSKRNIV